MVKRKKKKARSGARVKLSFGGLRDAVGRANKEMQDLDKAVQETASLLYNIPERPFASREDPACFPQVRSGNQFGKTVLGRYQETQRKLAIVEAELEHVKGQYEVARVNSNVCSAEHLWQTSEQLEGEKFKLKQKLDEFANLPFGETDLRHALHEACANFDKAKLSEDRVLARHYAKEVERYEKELRKISSPAIFMSEEDGLPPVTTSAKPGPEEEITLAHVKKMRDEILGVSGLPEHMTSTPKSGAEFRAQYEGQFKEEKMSTKYTEMLNTIYGDGKSKKDDKNPKIPRFKDLKCIDHSVGLVGKDRYSRYSAMNDMPHLEAKIVGPQKVLTNFAEMLGSGDLFQWLDTRHKAESDLAELRSEIERVEVAMNDPGAGVRHRVASFDLLEDSKRKITVEEHERELDRATDRADRKAERLQESVNRLNKTLTDQDKQYGWVTQVKQRAGSFSLDKCPRCGGRDIEEYISPGGFVEVCQRGTKGGGFASCGWFKEHKLKLRRK